MSGKMLDAAWLEWLQENLARRCEPEELLGILLKNGYAIESIRQHMGLLFPTQSPLLKNVGTAADDGLQSDYAAIARTRLTRPDSGLLALQLLTEKLQLYVVEGFLGDDECEQMIDIAHGQLRASTVTTGDRDKGYRTSSTSDLALLKDPYVAQMDEKIARALGIRLPYSEGIQAQCYERGQEFKQHTDYFQPGTGEYATYAGSQGQRTWTFMVYLNDGVKGGGTRFFAIDKVFEPRKGMAVVWNNLYPNGMPNPDTLHAGLPVEEGTKYIITKWFRDRGFGPMFW